MKKLNRTKEESRRVNKFMDLMRDWSEAELMLYALGSKNPSERRAAIDILIANGYDKGYRAGTNEESYFQAMYGN